jgi:hypothetical protein
LSPRRAWIRGNEALSRCRLHHKTSTERSSRVLPGTTSRARTRAGVSARAGGRCGAAAFGSPRGPLANFQTSPAGANRSVRELLDRPYGGEQVRGYLGHVVVRDPQDPEAATPGHERVANRPVLALGEKRGRVGRLTCGELEQITALAADARSLVRLRSVSHATFRPRESRPLANVRPVGEELGPGPPARSGRSTHCGTRARSAPLRAASRSPASRATSSGFAECGIPVDDGGAAGGGLRRRARLRRE